jgi:hypothetical protein
VVAGKKSCSLLEHQEMEKLNTARGKALFTLKARLQRAQPEAPNETVLVAEDSEQGDDDLQEDEEWFEVDGNNVKIFNEPNPGSIGVVDSNHVEVPCPSKKSDTGNKKIKAQFGRRRTHNEQTLPVVRPCGIIFARATMFGAEAVSNFLVRSIVVVG